MSTWHFVLRKTASRKEQYLQALGGAPDFMLSMQEEKRILHASLPLEHRTLPKLEWKNKQTKDKKVKKKKKRRKMLQPSVFKNSASRHWGPHSQSYCSFYPTSVSSTYFSWVEWTTPGENSIFFMLFSQETDSNKQNYDWKKKKISIKQWV